jgi:hypothetical protein
VTVCVSLGCATSLSQDLFKHEKWRVEGETRAARAGVRDKIQLERVREMEGVVTKQILHEMAARQDLKVRRGSVSPQ